MTKQAYCQNKEHPQGRQSAGESFLKAYFKYWEQERHSIVATDSEVGSWFHQEATEYNNKAETEVYSLRTWGDAASKTGAIYLPGPGLDEWAWKRMPWQDNKFSLVGMVHTLCTKSVQWGLGQFPTSPVREWDALICTSKASKEVVEGFLDRQEEWLMNRIGAQLFERPQLPVIPIGIHLNEWSRKKDKNTAKREARQKLHLHQDAVLVLIVGRIDFLTKFHPEPLLRVLEKLKVKHKTLELLIYGEAPNNAMEEIWKGGAEEICPSLKITWVEGKEKELAQEVRYASDIFVSLADNPQETFGITLLEAMASGLPCIVSDWNGYKDIVVNAEEGIRPTGYRIKTRMIEGLGEEEAKEMLAGTISYRHAVGKLAQGIAVDQNELEYRLNQLIGNELLREKMGDAGSERVSKIYDWKIVMRQLEGLLESLEELRNSDSKSNKNKYKLNLPPWLPEYSTSFGNYATEVIAKEWKPEKMPNKKEEQEIMRGIMQQWDQDLGKNISPRRKGWWLKQNLVSY